MKALTLVLMGLLTSQLAFAAQTKTFQCSVDTFVGKQTYGGWKSNQYKIEFSLKAEEFQGHDEGVSTQTIELDDGLSLVFDLRWLSGYLANDDITNIPEPIMDLSSRLQKKNADSSITVLDMDEVYAAKPDRDISPVTNKHHVTAQLSNTEAYSKELNQLNDPKASNDTLSRTTDKTEAIFIYQLDCTTSVK